MLCLLYSLLSLLLCVSRRPAAALTNYRALLIIFGFVSVMSWLRWGAHFSKGTKNIIARLASGFKCHLSFVEYGRIAKYSLWLFPSPSLKRMKAFPWGRGGVCTILEREGRLNNKYVESKQKGVPLVLYC